MKRMYPVEYNLSLAGAILSDLEGYLLSSDLYWPLGTKAPPGGPPFPRLTLGSLLLTLDELTAQKESHLTTHSVQRDRLLIQFQAFQDRWPAGMERKATHEMQSRLYLWKSYLAEIEESSSGAEDYKREVRHRVFFERLSELAEKRVEAQDLIQKMRRMDSQIRRRWFKSEFIWDEALERIYPDPKYWFLYGHPR